MKVFAILLGASLVLCGYVLARNYYVGKFRSKVINLCYKHNLRRIDETMGGNYESAYDWFFHKYSYEEMLFSFKLLKLEYWYTKEEIERLMS